MKPKQEAEPEQDEATDEQNEQVTEYTLMETLAEYNVDLSSLNLVEKRTVQRQQAFLNSYAIVGEITTAATAAGISRIAVWYWREADAHGFKRRFEDAVQGYGDSLERLAMERLETPAGNRGSDVLLIALLNANRPEKYRQNVTITDDRGKEVLNKLSERRKATIIEGEARQLPIEEGGQSDTDSS